MMTCIAYLPTGYLCRRHATHLDQAHGGWVCDAHRTLRHAVAEETDRLRGVFVQRGADGLIADAADTIATLRHGLAVFIAAQERDADASKPRDATP